ncbi:hypothetical protein [Nonomuraea sp. B12E4]|uniref:hypothetical protein n=1 Tax=Nonomuraea sp. B12E4 TaxID=3153564 RepID=UPI00325FD3A4
MLAVLLASSPPEQNRPTGRDALDLVRGGLAIRLRRAVSPGSRWRWRHAVDLAALLAPLVLFGAGLFRAAALAGRLAFDQSFQGLVYALPYALIVLLAWLGRRRAAAACAWAMVALQTADTTIGLMPLSKGTVVMGDVLLASGQPLIAVSALLTTLPACVCAAMLTLAPSPSPGPLGSRRLLAWTGGVLIACVVGAMIPRVFGVVLVLAALGTVAVMALRSPVGRRVAVTMAPFLIAAVLPGGFAQIVSLGALGMTAAVVLAITTWLARSTKPA